MPHGQLRLIDGFLKPQKVIPLQFVETATRNKFRYIAGSEFFDIRGVYDITVIDCDEIVENDTFSERFYFLASA